MEESSPVRVLYVTPEPDRGGLPAALDATRGFDVRTAASDAVAERAVDVGRFDCVVCAAGGVDLLETVREGWPDVACVFVGDGGADADAALARGADDYLERRPDRDQRRLLATRIGNVVAAGRTGRDGDRGRDPAPDTDAERPHAERDADRSESYLRELYRTAADGDLSFEEKRRRLLELGRRRIGVDVGFVSRIDGETFEIREAVGSHELLQSGRTAPMSETYCRRTVDVDGLLCVRDAASEGWAGDRAYETYGLGCYVGAKVVVDGELYGTVCFADRNPRERTFSDGESAYVELITQWLRYELEQRADERRLQEQNERLEQFAGVVSHDLRNPLNVARVYLEMARETGAEEDFDEIARAHDRMERLIAKLLALTKAGEAAGEVSDLDLAAVGEEAWASVETGDATLRVETGGTVRASRECFQRLLENLFRNAVEHGDGDVTVRLGTLDSGFYVADDGPGIPEGEREAVFEYGYSTAEGGTGLGLSIVENIADAHGWELTVTESESGGAAFEVRGAEP